MGFIDKLIEMFKICKILRDFKSTYLQSIIAPKIKEVDLSIQRIANKARFEFHVGIYNALRLQCESKYDILNFMNRDLWVKIAEPLCDRTHS